MKDEHELLNSIGPVSISIFGLSSLALAYALAEFFHNNNSHIVAISILMMLICIYSCWRILREIYVTIFVIIYVLLHVVFCFVILPEDGSYVSIIILPVAILDYVVMVLIVHFIHNKFAGRQKNS